MAGASKFTNRDRLTRRFKSIPIEVRKAVRAQNNANADEMVRVAKGFAETSRETGELIASIRSHDTTDSTRIRARVSAGAGGAYYARFVEFGTAASDAQIGQLYKRQKGATRGLRRKDKQAHAATAARPFFWPAYRLLRRRFRARIMRAAKSAIQGAVK